MTMMTSGAGAPRWGGGGAEGSARRRSLSELTSRQRRQNEIVSVYVRRLL